MSQISAAVARRVEAMSIRHGEILAELNSASSSGDGASLGKELAILSPVAALNEKMETLREERRSLEELMREAKDMEDGDMEKECQVEVERLGEVVEALEGRVVDAVLPKDEDDFVSDAVLEIRAGTGGDEAALFAKEMLAAYEKSAKSRGWKVEVLHVSKTDTGGAKEAAISISGSGGGGAYATYGNIGSDPSDEDILARLAPYGFFKFESGVHRVQRVPVNDVRIHTSACTVAVLPAADPSSSSDALLPMSELRIETMRASGAGGQHVNTTDSAVRITHIPTGITASIQDERSQHKNKAKALKLVSARVRDKIREEEARERGDARNTLMGGGDRSERIRTYNFPQDRVTDHRCKLSEHGISKLLEGGGDSGLVTTFAPPMRLMYREEMLKEMEMEEETRWEGKAKAKKGSKKR